jgi:hypothetical protein
MDHCEAWHTPESPQNTASRSHESHVNTLSHGEYARARDGRVPISCSARERDRACLRGARLLSPSCCATATSARLAPWGGGFAAFVEHVEATWLDRRVVLSVDNDVHWLKVLVDAGSREVFAYQPQIVPANRTAVPPP